MTKLRVKKLRPICPYCAYNIQVYYHDEDCKVKNYSPYIGIPPGPNHEIINDEFVIKYTDIEAGSWKTISGKIRVSEIIKNPKVNKGYRKESLWGDIHSFVTESGKRFDAWNHEIMVMK